jgi:hypothetical protein
MYQAHAHAGGWAFRHEPDTYSEHILAYSVDPAVGHSGYSSSGVFAVEYYVMSFLPIIAGIRVLSFLSIIPTYWA